MVQWLGLRAFTAKGLGSVPDGELKSCKPNSAAKKKKKKYDTITLLSLGGIFVLFSFF